MHEQVMPVKTRAVCSTRAPWLQEMNPLSLLISELTKMLALSYDIRHPSRYLWLTLLVVHNLSLSILICLLSDMSPAASLICLSHSCFFIPPQIFPFSCYRFALFWFLFEPLRFLLFSKKSKKVLPAFASPAFLPFIPPAISLPLFFSSVMSK